MRWALGVEYDGRAFCGWQTQPGGGSVQNALEAALATIAGHPVGVVAAGRTDAGVHASGQVVHFDAQTERPASAWVRGSNSHLPDGVAVTWAVPVAEAFHARFAAEGRHYRYVLLNRPVRPAIAVGRVGWFHRPLDLAAMQAGVERLLGRHDFSSFRAAACQARSPVRDLRHAAVLRRGDRVVFEFSADAFLHHMIRNLVGALIYVGKGALTADGLSALLQARDRRRAPPTFAPDGLYLTGVDYAPEWGIPARPEWGDGSLA